MAKSKLREKAGKRKGGMEIKPGSNVSWKILHNDIRSHDFLELWPKIQGILLTASVHNGARFNPKESMTNAFMLLRMLLPEILYLAVHWSINLRRMSFFFPFSLFFGGSHFGSPPPSFFWNAWRLSLCMICFLSVCFVTFIFTCIRIKFIASLFENYYHLLFLSAEPWVRWLHRLQKRENPLPTKEKGCSGYDTKLLLVVRLEFCDSGEWRVI